VVHPSSSRLSAGQTSQEDYWDQLETLRALSQMHHHPRKGNIAACTSNLTRMQVAALNHLRQNGNAINHRFRGRWTVDNSLEYLAQQVDQFPGEGLVSSHNDICNANWLFASDGKIYVVDLESMSMDDPAEDMGALLWWYYPPELRQRFLNIAGYRYDDEFKFRMQIRMAMHCLHITLPREHSFDDFDPNEYDEWLTDFSAILNGEENPQGYNG
jgi:thiamine kinase-like enzyme